MLGKLLPPNRQAQIDLLLKEYSAAIYNLCEEKLGEYWQEKIKEASTEAFHEFAREKRMPEGKEEKIEWFKIHQKELSKVLKEKILTHPELEDVKGVFEKELKEGAIYNEIRDRLDVKLSWAEAKKFMIGGSFMFVFGMVDNLGIFVGMAAVEDAIVGVGLSASIASGISNTFSDEVGVVLAWPVALLLSKFFQVKGEGTFGQQFVMITAGCMLPVILLGMWEWYQMHGFTP